MAHILLVDDDVGIRTVVTLMLAREGHTVAVACDGEEAVVALQESTPDVVLSDLCMPGIAGDELLRDVHLWHPAIGCILMTGDCDPEREEAMRPALLLRKPFLANELLAVVNAALCDPHEGSYSGAEREAFTS